MAKKIKLNQNETRIAYKSRIKISKEQKNLIDNSIFIINQVYNFVIEKLQQEEIQNKLIELNYGKLIDYNDDEKRFVITKKSKIRNLLTKEFQKYAEARRLKIKGLSKPIQLKIEAIIQNDLYHKIINKIAKISDLFFIEDLSIEGMMESKKVRNDNLYNASLSKLLTIVNNKMLTMGKVAIKVNPYNTSKECSTIGCNYVYEELTELNIREWYCNHCDTLHHRDLNAAKNILYKGLLTQGNEYKYSIELSNKPVKVFV